MQLQQTLNSLFYAGLHHHGPRRHSNTRADNALRQRNRDQAASGVQKVGGIRPRGEGGGLSFSRNPHNGHLEARLQIAPNSRCFRTFLGDSITVSGYGVHYGNYDAGLMLGMLCRAELLTSVRSVPRFGGPRWLKHTSLTVVVDSTLHIYLVNPAHQKKNPFPFESKQLKTTRESSPSHFRRPHYFLISCGENRGR